MQQLVPDELTESLASYLPPHFISGEGEDLGEDQYRRHFNDDSGGAPLPVDSWVSLSPSRSLSNPLDSTVSTAPQSTAGSWPRNRQPPPLPLNWGMDRDTTEDIGVLPHFHQGHSSPLPPATDADLSINLAPTHNIHALEGTGGGVPVQPERDHRAAARQQGIASAVSNCGDPSPQGSTLINFGAEAQSSWITVNNANNPSPAPSFGSYTTTHSDLSPSIDNDCGGAAITITGAHETLVRKGRLSNADHRIDEESEGDTEDDDSDGGIEFELEMDSARGQVEVLYPSSALPTLVDEEEAFSPNHLVTRPPSPVDGSLAGLLDILASQPSGPYTRRDGDVDISDSTMQLDTPVHLTPVGPTLEPSRSLSINSPQFRESRQIPADVLAFAQSINAPTEQFGVPDLPEDAEAGIYVFNGGDMEDGSMNSLDSPSERPHIAARSSSSPRPLTTSIVVEEMEDPFPAEDEGDTEIPNIDVVTDTFPAFSLIALDQPTMPSWLLTPYYISNRNVLFNSIMNSLDAFIEQEGFTNDVVFAPDFPPDFEKYNFDFAGFFGTLWNHQVLCRDGGRSPLPRVSAEAKRIAEWSQTRPVEITHEDTEVEGGDMQGISWDRLEITRREARRVRQRLYINYRNVESGKKENWPPIKSNKKFFSFRRLDTTQACRLMHFQLRNVFCMTSRNDLFYSTGLSVVAYHPITSSTCNLMDLSEASHQYNPIRISTLGACGGQNAVLIAGGFSGNYALKTLNANIEDEMEVGIVTDHENGITNHIQVVHGRTSGIPNAVFCSNDSFIRVMECGRGRQFLATHPFKWAVNCSATSPDGRLRAVVGDSKDVLIVDAERGSTEFTLTGHKDFGFAAAWSDDGYTIATGNQDRTVRIFDARYLTKTLKVLPSLMAGCRTLRFSPLGNGGRPVLAMAEPADYLHVIDAVTWEDAQTVQFWGEIGGMEFSPNGDELVLANCDKSVGGLMTFARSHADGWYDHQPTRQIDSDENESDASESEDWSYTGRPWRRMGTDVKSVFL
ncbi:hypothetical protein EDC01DRAFT_650129 [Geopyxis carbonaria]|nr:hypothetical protein EDC01DRAFT_650129 [Geopyxis carbonaria]